MGVTEDRVAVYGNPGDSGEFLSSNSTAWPRVAGFHITCMGVMELQKVSTNRRRPAALS